MVLRCEGLPTLHCTQSEQRRGSRSHDVAAAKARVPSAYTRRATATAPDELRSSNAKVSSAPFGRMLQAYTCRTCIRCARIRSKTRSRECSRPSARPWEADR